MEAAMTSCKYSSTERCTGSKDSRQREAATAVEDAEEEAEAEAEEADEVEEEESGDASRSTVAMESI